MLNFPNFLYTIGSAVCSQRASNSFFYGSEQLPLGARWIGITLGIFTVILYWFLTSKRKNSFPPQWSIVISSLIFVIYFAFDSLSSVFKADYVNNFTRLFSGLLFGIAIGIFLMLALNSSLWKNSSNKKEVISGKGFLILILVNFLFFIAFFYNVQSFIYLSAFISIFSLIFLFFSINFVIILLVPYFAKNIAKRSAKIKLAIFTVILTLIEFSFLIYLRSLAEPLIK